MADIAALIQPRVHDMETLQEFIDDLTDLVPKIERGIAELKHTPEDHTLIANLFRALHNIKGDAAICRVDVGIAIAHPIETLLSRLRAGEIAFSDLFAEVVLLAMDRLELATEALATGRPVAHLKLVDLVGGLEGMASLPASEIDGAAANLIEAVTGFRPAQAPRTSEAAEPSPRKAPVGPAGENMADDLQFFRQIATQFEARSPLFKGRADRLTRLARETNWVAGSPIDPLQLEAAVLMHDVGMMFLPESVWLKVGKLSDEDKQALHAHPGYGAEILRRMARWHPAAEMVAQHHEMPDGTGYPARLGSREICPGAKVLSIIDAFEAVTLKHSHRGHGRSLLRAIAEINACDNQFAPEWIGHFNTVIRRMVEA